MNLSLIYGTIIGLLLGLAYCYWKQIMSAYNNRGVLGAGDTLLSDAQTFYSNLRKKF